MTWCRCHRFCKKSIFNLKSLKLLSVFFISCSFLLLMLLNFSRHKWHSKILLVFLWFSLGFPLVFLWFGIIFSWIVQILSSLNVYIYCINILLLHWGNVVVILIIAFSLWKKLFKNNDHDVAFYSGLKLLFSDCIS